MTMLPPGLPLTKHLVLWVLIVVAIYIVAMILFEFFWARFSHLCNRPTIDGPVLEATAMNLPVPPKFVYATDDYGYVTSLSGFSPQLCPACGSPNLAGVPCNCQNQKFEASIDVPPVGGPIQPL